VHKMHDKVDHASKKPRWKYLFQLAQSDSNVTLQSVHLILCYLGRAYASENADISTRGLTSLSGSDWRNAIGRSCCISTWLSWLFNIKIVRSLSRTHHEMFEAYPSETLTFRSTFRKFSLSSLDIVWQAASIYVLLFVTMNRCNLCLNPISCKSSRAARLSFIFPLMSRIVPNMLSMTFFFYVHDIKIVLKQIVFPVRQSEENTFLFPHYIISTYCTRLSLLPFLLTGILIPKSNSVQLLEDLVPAWHIWGTF
jgi:hypothetical protein